MMTGFSSKGLFLKTGDFIALEGFHHGLVRNTTCIGIIRRVAGVDTLRGNIGFSLSVGTNGKGHRIGCALIELAKIPRERVSVDLCGRGIIGPVVTVFGIADVSDRAIIGRNKLDPRRELIGKRNVLIANRLPNNLTNLRESSSKVIFSSAIEERAPPSSLRKYPSP